MKPKLMGGGNILWKQITEQLNSWKTLEEVFWTNKELVARYQLYLKINSYKNWESWQIRIWWKQVNISIDWEVSTLQSYWLEKSPDDRTARFDLVKEFWPKYLQYIKEMSWNSWIDFSTEIDKAKTALVWINSQDLSKVSLEELTKLVFFNPKEIVNQRANQYWHFQNTDERLSYEKAVSLVHKFRDSILFSPITLENKNISWKSEVWISDASKANLTWEFYNTLGEQDPVDLNNRWNLWPIWNQSLDVWWAFSNSWEDIALDKLSDEDLQKALWEVFKNIDSKKEELKKLLTSDKDISSSDISSLFDGTWATMIWKSSKERLAGWGLWPVVQLYKYLYFWWHFSMKLASKINEMKEKKGEIKLEKKRELEKERDFLKSKYETLGEEWKKKVW